MENFSIEFDHTDAEIASFATRCGCRKCERYRATHTEPARVVTTEHVQLTPTSAPVEVQRVTTPAPAVAGYCNCPIGTRPGVVPGSSALCQACGLPRRRASRPAPAPATQSSEHNRQMGAALGVQTDLRNPTGEIVSPRDAVISDIDAKLRGGLGATNRDLRKWDTLLRSITVTASANPNGHVRHTEVVAGARTNASGIFLGFNGLGTLTRAELAAVISAAGMPSDWLPAAKSAHAQAGRIVGGLHRHGYIVRAARIPVKTAEVAKHRYETYGHAFNSSAISYGIPTEPHHERECPLRGTREETEARGLQYGGTPRKAS